MSFVKSELSFSKNVGEDRRREIQSIMGIREVHKHEKYLGLPTIIGRSKKAIFGQLKERVWSKVSGWNEKNLSRVGKEVMIKSVAKVIPTYMMSCFALPKGLCEDIEQLMCNFWWGYGIEKGKIHWLR